MNNKILGTEFEQEFCELLNKNGFWVHFCTPNASGAQPCDVIAAKNGEAFLIDCKTSSKKIFSINRIEDNQMLAFSKWKKCGNFNACVAVKYKDNIYIVPYFILHSNDKITLDDDLLFDKWLCYLCGELYGFDIEA